MKTNIFSILAMMVAVLSFFSCTEDMEYKDLEVTPVTQFYSPVDEAAVTLQSSATAAVFFEWASALAEDGNSPQYELVFDKADGDFSSPVYRMTSDDTGSRNYATVSHKTLDKIASLAGIGSGDTGKLKWTVVASRGISQAVTSLSRTMTVTRLLGFSELPSSLFITGDGSEGGSDVSKALAFSSPANGEFEIFTRLEAGKTYHFVSDKKAGARVFYTNSGLLKESTDGTGSATVEETGVYRINLDFNVASASMTKVVSVGWFFCPDNKVDISLDYQGNGVWQGSGKTEFHQESWGRDQRYKFEMVLDNDGTQTTVHWGPTNVSLDSAPGENEDPFYYNMQQWQVSQWDNKWKLRDIFDGAETKFTFILNGEGAYRHTVELAK